MIPVRPSEARHAQSLRRAAPPPGGFVIVPLLRGGAADVTLSAVCNELSNHSPAVDIRPVDLRGILSEPLTQSGYTGPGVVQRPTSESLGLTGDYTLQSTRGYSAPWSAGAQLNRQLRVTASAYLRQLGAHVVLTCTDIPFAHRAFIGAARDLGIPIILLQPGPLTTIGPVGFARVKAIVTKAGYGNFIPYDLVLATSAYDARLFLRKTRSRSVEIIGAPRLDPHALAREADGNKSPERHILYVHQPLVEDGVLDEDGWRQTVASLSAFVGFLGTQMGAPVHIRAHPRASPKSLDLLLRAITGASVSTSGETLEQALDGSLIVVGHYSTALLEAYLRGVRVICHPVDPSLFLKKEEKGKQVWLRDLGLPRSLHEEAVDGRDLFEKLARRDKIAAKVIDRIGPFDGNARKRAATRIMDFLKTRSHQNGEAS